MDSGKRVSRKGGARARAGGKAVAKAGRADGAMHSEIIHRLAYMESMEKRVDESIERKLFELKAVSYVSLFLSAVLVALVLGILLRAIGF